MDLQVSGYGSSQISKLSTHSQSQDLFSLFSYFWFNLKSIVALGKHISNLTILSLASHLSYRRNHSHMHEPQPSTSRVETQEKSRKYYERRFCRPFDGESDDPKNLTTRAFTPSRCEPMETPRHPAERPSNYKINTLRTREHPTSSGVSVTSHGGSVELYT